MPQIKIMNEYLGLYSTVCRGLDPVKNKPCRNHKFMLFLPKAKKNIISQLVSDRALNIMIVKKRKDVVIIPSKYPPQLININAWRQAIIIIITPIDKMGEGFHFCRSLSNICHLQHNIPMTDRGKTLMITFNGSILIIGTHNVSSIANDVSKNAELFFNVHISIGAMTIKKM